MATQHLPETIQVNSGVATLINVFTIDPEGQQALLDLLTLKTDSLMRKQPGFLNANFHRSLDRVSVVNYTQWTVNQRSSEVIHENPETVAGFAQYQILNVEIDLRYYEVASTVGQQTVIKPQNEVTTLISLFSTKPSQQQALGILEQEVYPFAVQQTGFISMNLHRSLDGARILNYSQWNAQATHKIPDLLKQREPLMSILEGACNRIETHLYEVSFTADVHSLFIGKSA